MPNNIETVYHAYRFDVKTEHGKAGYRELTGKLHAQGLKCFETWGGNPHYQPELDGLAIELETKQLFNNQWNTAPIPGISEKGLRVFDWGQDFQTERGMKNIKRGHYLDQLPVMVEVRKNTYACGYCGKQEPVQTAATFCPHCIDSEYLKVSDLNLLRMAPVCDSDKPRAELTDAERAQLLPIYKNAQLHGTTERGIARIADARLALAEEYAKSVRNATAKHDGFIFLMDHGVNTSNVIYYPHTGRFSFGWRNPVSDEIVSELLDIISEFPFPYDIECADGRKLSGN